MRYSRLLAKCEKEFGKVSAGGEGEEKPAEEGGEDETKKEVKKGGGKKRKGSAEEEKGGERRPRSRRARSSGVLRLSKMYIRCPSGASMSDWS